MFFFEVDDYRGPSQGGNPKHFAYRQGHEPQSCSAPSFDRCQHVVVEQCDDLPPTEATRLGWCQVSSCWGNMCKNKEGKTEEEKKQFALNISE